MKHEHDIETRVSLGDSGSEVEVCFTRTYYTERDERGSDADGHRGLVGTIVEDDRAESVHVRFGNDWVSVDELGPSLRLKILDAVDKWLELNDVRDI